ncbi:penicillin-binding transpeptidase domain-containing protein [Bacillus sp. FJAT-49736]|uniref:peptidoglycan D,D-transpeptidase FtsI family protein n=1 Tax=Bacillus sp. FJAT-49736 TaxID=2833582 RepID=UPI001BC97D54|nr:penicillin-binding transpeptidase domain-containing protein [Bacillus sp. FJAT-49736]MBS4173630.1 penicillin-binding protein 2 [Bacillus sp. FJAT-49736]
MRIKRYYFLAVLILFMIAALIARLVQIQLMETESFTKHHINLMRDSVAQRTQEIVIDDGRGQFLDRNNKPLTYSEKPVLILFPFLKNTVWDKHKIATILNISETSFDSALEDAKEPFVFGGKNPFILSEMQVKEINNLKVPGVFAVYKRSPSNNNIASQLIGIVGEQAETFLKRYPDKKGMQNVKIGITGLQKQFDEFLLPEGASKLVYHVDALGQPLFGVDVKYTGSGNPYYPVNVQTTIDRDLQEKIESLVNKYPIQKGGVILLDIEKNEILANVSRPLMDPKHPFANEASVNMMTAQQIPGSIFKTVIAAASIENETVNEQDLFHCSENMYGKPDKRKLGELNFEESFAESCNRAFGDLAKRLKDKNPNLIEEYAERLGLIGEISWNGDIFRVEDFYQLHVDKGQVFANSESKTDDNLVAQTGIGQQEVRVTPLGVANMMATIARGGQKEMIRAVSSLKYKDGTTLVDFPQKNLDGDTISSLTAMKLQKMLRQVITSTNGTGRWFQNLPYEVAGKSGTAETGIFKGNEQLHNKWFAGYFPFNQPKYALVVVNLGVPENDGGINPLFADIVNLLYKENIK